MPPETQNEPHATSGLGTQQTNTTPISEPTPQPVDPNSAQKTALVKTYKVFRDKFYEQTTLREQAVIVNALLSVLIDITKKEEQEAAAAVRDSTLNEEPDGKAPKPKSAAALKAAIRAFRRDLLKSTELVKKTQALTKGGFLAGDQARQALLKFAQKVQEDNVSLNKELNNLLAPPPEQVPIPINEIEGAEEYKKKIQAIEKVHDIVTGTDISLGGIDGIVKLLSDSDQTEPQWPEVKKAVINALKLLSTIKKWFPSLLPFEKGQVENEKLLEAYQQAIEKFNIDASDIQTLEDAIEGDASIMFLKRFQQKLVEFSMDMENIFGIQGLRSDNITKDRPPGEEEAETEGELKDLRAKYETMPFFKGLPPEQQRAILYLVQAMQDQRMLQENFEDILNGSTNKPFKEAYNSLDQDIKDILKTTLDTKEKVSQFLDMLKASQPEDEEEKITEFEEVVDELEPDAKAAYEQAQENLGSDANWKDTAAEAEAILKLKDKEGQLERDAQAIMNDIDSDEKKLKAVQQAIQNTRKKEDNVITTPHKLTTVFTSSIITKAIKAFNERFPKGALKGKGNITINALIKFLILYNWKNPEQQIQENVIISQQGAKELSNSTKMMGRDNKERPEVLENDRVMELFAAFKSQAMHQPMLQAIDNLIKYGDKLAIKSIMRPILLGWIAKKKPKFSMSVKIISGIEIGLGPEKTQQSSPEKATQQDVIDYGPGSPDRVNETIQKLTRALKPFIKQQLRGK